MTKAGRRFPLGVGATTIPCQNHTPAADERHVSGRDGLRLGGRWCNGYTHGSEDHGQ